MTKVFSSQSLELSSRMKSYGAINDTRIDQTLYIFMHKYTVKEIIFIVIILLGLSHKQTMPWSRPNLVLISMFEYYRQDQINGTNSIDPISAFDISYSQTLIVSTCSDYFYSLYKLWVVQWNPLEKRTTQLLSPESKWCKF